MSPMKNLFERPLQHIERTTFVLAPDGRIAATVGGVAPEANVIEALEAVRKLGAARKS